jgi:putative two-component system response regulator
MEASQSTSGSGAAEALHAHRVILFAVATLAELRESDTESHILRVQHYVRSLLGNLQSHPGLQAHLTPEYVETLCASVPMYDMGTVGIPDRILLKPGRLNPDEVAIMRTHTTLGHDAIVRAEKTLGRASPLLSIAKEITWSHQEKWDGSGYPQGLRELQIPLSISHKVYKDGIAHEAAVSVIFGERGSHFDPDVVDAFMEVHPEFAEIAKRYADTDADMQQKIEYMANAIAEIAEL